MKTFKLKNGITSVQYPINNKKSVEIALYIRIDDIEDFKPGIAHFLEHIHYRQLGNMNQKQIYDSLNRMGTYLDGATYKKMIKFYVKVRPQYTKPILRLFEEILKTYNWTEKQFEDEKQVVLSEINEKDDETYFESINYKLIWGDGFLSKPILGEYDDIGQLTLQELVDYKKKIFISQNLALIVTGNYNETELNDCLNEIGNIELNNYSPLQKNIVENKVQFHRNPDIVIKRNKAWSSVDVRINIDIDSDKVKENERLFLSSIIGGGDGSILTQELRDNMELVYDVYSYIESSTLLSIEFSVDCEKLALCLKTIIDMLKNMGTIITQKDIDTNIAYFTDNLWFWEDEDEKINDYLGEEFIEKKEFTTIEERIKSNGTLSLERMREIADFIFQPENLSLSIIGDAQNVTKKSVMEMFVEW